jgi:hypothetical protein
MKHRIVSIVAAFLLLASTASAHISSAQAKRVVVRYNDITYPNLASTGSTIEVACSGRICEVVALTEYGHANFTWVSIVTRRHGVFCVHETRKLILQ